MQLIHFALEKNHITKKLLRQNTRKYEAIFLNTFKSRRNKVDNQHIKSKSESRGIFNVPSFSFYTGPNQNRRVPVRFHTDTHRERLVCTVGSPYHTLSSPACWSCTAAVADGGDFEGCGVTVIFGRPCQRWRMTYRWTRRWRRSL